MLKIHIKKFKILIKNMSDIIIYNFLELEMKQILM
jgi:hypothetical protein